VNYAAEVKIRAERLLGEMLAQTPKNPGSRTGGTGGSIKEPPVNVPTLEEIGVDKKLSMRSQQLASVPIQTFEDALDAQKSEGKEITTTATLRRVIRAMSTGPDWKRLSCAIVSARQGNFIGQYTGNGLPNHCPNDLINCHF
jgi:hypothetical protein